MSKIEEVNSIDEKKLKQQLYHFSRYYKDNDEVMKIINNDDISLSEKYTMIKEYLNQFKKCNSYYKKYDVILEKITVELVEEMLYNKTMKNYYENLKVNMSRRYHECPEYKASIKLQNYKKYMDVYPEVKSIFENEELSKVEKLEQIKSVLMNNRKKK
jgi:hypothetical protein